MRSFADYIARAERQHGEKFDMSSLDPKFIPYYQSEQRVKVLLSGFEVERTGRVGVTTGWRPSFMLLLKATSQGSVYLLGPLDEIVSIKVGRHYIPLRTN